MLIAFLLLSIYIDRLPNLYRIIIIHIVPPKITQWPLFPMAPKKFDLCSRIPKADSKIEKRINEIPAATL